MTLRDYLRVARRWWWLVALGVAVAAAVSFVVTSRLTKEYEANAQVAISVSSQDNNVYEALLGSQSIARTYARLVTGNVFLQRIADQVGGITAKDLDKKVTAVAVPDTSVIEIGVRDKDPQRAADIAKALADAFPGYVKEVQGQRNDTTFVLEKPEVPDDPVSPNVTLNVALGAILGLILLVAAVAIIEYLDDGIDERSDVEALSVPFLGQVLQVSPPRGVERRNWVPSIIQGDPRSPLAESYRQVQASLAFAIGASDTKVLLVTSPGPGEGKSTTAANLAEALAESSRNVLLIDGDLRKPDAHRYFSLPNTSGLTSAFLVDPQSVQAFVARVSDNLSVLTGGPVPPNPTELLTSHKLRALLPILAEPFDIVIIDSPPMLGLADASLWLPHIDGVLIVARRGKTRRGPLQDTVNAVRASRKPLLGVVLNGANRRKTAPYDYRYGYGYSKTKKSEQ